MANNGIPKIAVIYFSKADAAGALAREVIRGARRADAEVLAHSISGFEIVDGRFRNPDLFRELPSCDALIFGSPTYMGGVAAQFKAFADASADSWAERKWMDKLAAGFTCGGSPNGDQSVTLQYLSTLASQHGMLWVNLDVQFDGDESELNRLGTHLGVVAQSVDGQAVAADLATAHHLGRRVATLARKQMRS